MERHSTRWKRMLAEKRYVRGWRLKIYLYTRAARKVFRLLIFVLIGIPLILVFERAE